MARQKKAGIVPQNTVLPPLNTGIKPWQTLSAEEKKVFARFMEAYAGFLSHTDYEIGRLVTYLKTINQLDNTLIVVMVGDNGASKEGGLTGNVNGINEYITGSLFEEKYEDQIKNISKVYDEIGSGHTSINYPQGWAMAANTPFRYLKQDANSEGGTRNPLIIFYPKGIKDKGGIRTQYSHINSVLPTTIELTGTTIPEAINGYKQDSLEGTSLAYTIHDPKAANRHRIQYYEVYGSRAIYKDGWKAGVYHKRGEVFTNDKWELYNLNEDFNERTNLAAKNPAQLKELEELFDSEAAKYNIYPLLGDTTSRGTAAIKNNFGSRKEIVLYPGIWQINTSGAPPLALRSFSITADADLTNTSEGVLLATGGRFNGFSFFIKNGKLQITHNSNKTFTHLESSQPLPAGKAALRYELNYVPAQKLSDPAGTEALFVNGIKVAERTITKLEALISPYDEGLDVGQDLLSPVSDRYEGSFPFTGKLHKITINYK